MRKRVLEIMQEYLAEIVSLDATDKEIYAFCDSLKNGYGIVTVGDRRTDFRLPFIHETWHKKWGGRTHIDMGDKNGSIHLMLDKNSAPMFIEFIKAHRKNRIT
jgi:hypothetical protein